jgi:hypothetical protein
MLWLRESWHVVANVLLTVATDIYLKGRCNNESNDKRKHRYNTPVHKMEFRMSGIFLVESNAA